MPHPNPVTAEQLAELTGRDVAEFAGLLAAIDQQAHYDTARGQLLASVWDEVSPVNGTDAATVLDALDVPDGGAVVLIGDGDGTTRVLQPFDPEQPGQRPIAEADAQALADRMADAMAAEQARGATIAELPAELFTGGGTPGGGGEPPAPEPTLAELAGQVTAQAGQLAAQQETIDALVLFITEGV